MIKAAAAAVAVAKILVPSEAMALNHNSSYNPAKSQIYSDRQQHSYRQQKYEFSSFVVKGATSTFGWPIESKGVTADGGSTARPCIALRNHSTLGHNFLVTVLVDHIKHQAEMPQCDWGPALWTGRNIDITGEGVGLLHFSQSSYPTGAWGIAQEINKTLEPRNVSYILGKLSTSMQKQF